MATDTILSSAPEADETQARDRLAERVLESVIGSFDVASIYLGDRLGYYTAIADAGAMTAGELAARTGTYPRYAREWLEQQAVTGFLTVDDASLAPDERRYTLPPGHAEVLTDRDSLAYMAPSARQLIGSLAPLPAVLEAFRSGGGVDYTDYGPDIRDGIAEGNRALFVNLLGSDWFPAIPVIDRRLKADPPARVVDFGCGSGWSSITIARAYPTVHVDGFDLDTASVAQAQTNVTAEGLTDRVHIEERDAADPALAGRYDLACAFECIHDMAAPVGALRTMRRLVGDDGIVLVVDEAVAESFAAPGEWVERLMYGFSIFHCLPVGMTERPSAETGTVMRPDTLRRYAAEAGFRDMTIAPVTNDLWRFYLLT